MDVNRTRLKIEDPATLQVGTVNAAQLRDIIAGTALFDFSGGIVASGTASAAATVLGITTNHRAVVVSQSAVSLAVIGVACTADTLTVSASNCRTAAVSGTSAMIYNYFAWRNT